MADSTNNTVSGTSTWAFYLCRFGLLTHEQTWHKRRLAPDTLKLVDSVDKIYIERVPRNERDTSVEPCDLTKSAMRRVWDALGTVDAYGAWPVKVVSVEYK